MKSSSSAGISLPSRSRRRNNSFVIDGEAVLLGVDGRSDFDGLHSPKHDGEVEFYAFDMLVSDGRICASCR